MHYSRWGMYFPALLNTTHLSPYYLPQKTWNNAKINCETYDMRLYVPVIRSAELMKRELSLVMEGLKIALVPNAYFIGGK